MAKVAIQGGVKNYLPSNEVTVPKKAKSSKNHPATELAYITKAEKDLLIKKDLHNSLNGKPNKGPGGIISLNGDFGIGESYGDRQTTDTSPEVGDRGGGYQEKGDPGYNETIQRIRQQTKKANKNFNEKKAKKEAKKFRETKYSQGYKPINFIEKANYFNRQRNLELAKKRAFQKYQDVEQYVDPFDDYTMSGQKMAELRGYTFDDQGNITGYDRDKATAYGYDTSALAKGMDTLTSNKGTSIETTRPNLYDVNSPVPGVLSLVADKLRPDTQRTVLNTLGKAAEYNILGINAPNMTNQQISDEMYRLKNLGRTQDQIDFIEGGGGGGGGSQQYIPYLPPEEDVADETTFDYRFGTGQKIGRDVTLGYAANGGRITRANGGIMSVVPRQGYFLGKIVKGVGKAIGSVADAAGKVLKSDVGKMALLAGGAYLAGGYLPGGGGIRGGFANFSNLAKNALLKDRTAGFVKGNLSLGKILGLSAALPFIPGINKAPENEDIGMTDRGGRLLDSQGNEVLPSGIRKEIDEAYASGDAGRIKAIENYYAFLPPIEQYLPYPNYAVGGRVAAQEGGLMNLGGMEKDYRNEGGFVPIGKQEKADDVPARLSVNEFVFTADAVRNAGGGDIDKGAEVMENMMKNLENGGRVSEESQGNAGAQEMFSVSERIGEVI